jgi:hypothetical protein
LPCLPALVGSPACHPGPPVKYSMNYNNPGAKRLLPAPTHAPARLQASASVPLARKVLQDLLSPANAKESESDHKRPQGQMHQSRLTASDQVSEASPALRGPRHSPRAFHRARRPLQRMMCRSRATESSRNRKDNQQCDSASFSKLTKPVSPADWRILYIYYNNIWPASCCLLASAHMARLTARACGLGRTSTRLRARPLGEGATGPLKFYKLNIILAPFRKDTEFTRVTPIPIYLWNTEKRLVEVHERSNKSAL